MDTLSSTGLLGGWSASDYGLVSTPAVALTRLPVSSRILVLRKKNQVWLLSKSHLPPKPGRRS